MTRQSRQRHPEPAPDDAAPADYHSLSNRQLGRLASERAGRCNAALRAERQPDGTWIVAFTSPNAAPGVDLLAAKGHTRRDAMVALLQGDDAAFASGFLSRG